MLGSPRAARLAFMCSPSKDRAGQPRRAILVTRGRRALALAEDSFSTAIFFDNRRL